MMKLTHNRRGFAVVGVRWLVSLWYFAFLIGRVEATEPQQEPWKADWEVPPGFSLNIDTEGYHFPAAIAFVPKPGKGPRDPLYFVTELRGAVKVVTNDRTVYTFAKDFFRLEPKQELPLPEGEVGMAGIALEPEHGYVYVTFVYQDENDIYHNNIARFHTRPQTFSIEPTSMDLFTAIFEGERSAISHQIGGAAVRDGHLYVGVGEAFEPLAARSPHSTRGKVLRMTLDGKPSPDNPFYQDEDVTKAANYVWALGLRNPFGLTFVKDELFVADNGPDIDRFVRIGKGEDYLWDGTGWSLAARADYIFAPAVSPVHLTYVPQQCNLFPAEYRSRFYIVLSGSPTPGPGLQGQKSVVSIQYDREKRRVTAPPEMFLRYVGSRTQAPVGIALGPDGLYVTPLFDVRKGTGAVLRIEATPEAEHPFLLSRSLSVPALIAEKGCLGCHSLNREDSSVGGSLDAESLGERVRERLDSPAYRKTLDELDTLDKEPFHSYRSAREQIRQEGDGEDRIRRWIKYKLMEPRFDNMHAQMPNLEIRENQAEAITAYLLADVPLGERLVTTIEDLSPGAVRAVKTWIPRPRYRHFALFYLVGILSGLAFCLVGFAAFVSSRRFRIARRRVSRSAVVTHGGEARADLVRRSRY